MSNLNKNQFKDNKEPVDFWHLSKLDYLASRDHEEYAAKGEHPKTFWGKEDCPKCNPEYWHVWTTGKKYDNKGNYIGHVEE